LFFLLVFVFLCFFWFFLFLFGIFILFCLLCSSWFLFFVVFSLALAFGVMCCLCVLVFGEVFLGELFGCVFVEFRNCRCVYHGV